MSISFEKLQPPRWGGPVPEPVERPPCVLGPNCVIDPPVVLSPMAAVTNPPFRKICREMGAGMVVTEMVHAVGLAKGWPQCLKLVDIEPDEDPISIQIYGHDPGAMAEAAQIVEGLGAHSVDVNMGCPMRKIVQNGNGAALLREPRRVYEIFKAMTDAVSIPVTGKTRVGWDGTDAIEVALAMEEAGAAAITIHGRTRTEMYDGHVDLAVIRELKQAVGIKVIGNGDVCDVASARRMFEITGCDAVMVARGCLGNPWVFQELKADLSGDPVPPRPTPAQKSELLKRHTDLYIASFGEEITCLHIRKHLLWYFRATEAEPLLRRRLRGITAAEDIYAAIDEAVLACEA